MRDDLLKYGYNIKDNLEKTADALYQRDPKADAMLQILLKQIVLFTKLLNEYGKTDDEDALKEWASSNEKLMDAIDAADIVLIADILHHEIAPQIKQFID